MAELAENSVASTNLERLQCSSKFLQRVGQISLVDQAITTTAGSYQRVKDATPTMMQPAIASVEGATARLLEQLLATVQTLPLPLALADSVACTSLDQLEKMAIVKAQVLERLRDLTRLPMAAAGDSEFYGRLLSFAAQTEDIRAHVGICGSVQAFVDTQLRLLERLEEAIDSFYKAQKRRLSSSVGTLEDAAEAGLAHDFAAQLLHVRQVFDDVMLQRNLLGWVRGGGNPLEAIWRHLHSSVQLLTPNDTMIQSFSDKLYFFKVILRSIVEQLKQAAKDPRSTLDEVRANVTESVSSLAAAWLPNFALDGIERITGHSFGTLALQKETPMPREPVVEEAFEKNLSTRENCSENDTERKTCAAPALKQSSGENVQREKKRVSIVDEPEYVEDQQSEFASIDEELVVEAEEAVAEADEAAAEVQGAAAEVQEAVVGQSAEGPAAEDEEIFSVVTENTCGGEKPVEMEATNGGDEQRKTQRNARRRKNKNAKSQEQF